MKNLDTVLRQSRSVLVVDADPDVLALVSEILEGPKTSEKPRMRVLRARNATEALDVLSRHYVPVDVVLSDFALTEPGSENLEQRIRELRPHVPVLGIQTYGLNGEGLFRAVVAALKPLAAVRINGSYRAGSQHAGEQLAGVNRG